MEITKTCSGCKVIKELSLFSSNKSKKDGLSNQCKACNSLNKAKRSAKKKQIKSAIKVEIIAGEIFTPVIHNNIEFEYLISTHGRLISLKNGSQLLMSPSKEPGRCNRPGYMGTSLRYPDKSKYFTVRLHRLVAVAFVSNPNNFKEVNHIDGDKTNNHFSNLEWCDRTTNIRHSFEYGLNIPKKGSKHHAFNKGRKVSLNGIVYNSVAECARSCGIPRTSLASELDGRMKTKAGIRYVD